MKYGFIGCGNMAKAILSGLIRSGMAKPEDITGSAPSEGTRKGVAEAYGIHVTPNNVEVCENADVLFLCVKPIFLAEVIQEISQTLPEEALVISIAAGRSLGDIEEAFDGKEESRRKIVRVMPNTPAMVGEGMSGICANKNVSQEELDLAVQIFSSLGQAEIVPERLFDAVGAVSGSSPAYVFLFIEALADGAVAEGMPRQQAYTFAAQSVLGSAKLMLESGKHPGELKDMVCSPGGTTIEAVRVLEEKGLRAAVMDAVHACVEKTKKL